jgi:hypothetical protein
MGSYWTTFRATTAGNNPAGWTALGVPLPASGGTWLVQVESEALGGQALELTSGQEAIQWDGPSADADRDDVEWLLRWRATGYDDDDFPTLILHARRTGSVSGGTEVAYRAQGSIGGGDPAILDARASLNRTSGGSSTSLDEVNPDSPTVEIVDPYIDSTWMRTRYRVVGDLVFLKVWVEADGEPAAWTIEAVDDNITGVGGVDIRFSCVGVTVQVDWIAVETGGGTAVQDFVDAGDIALSGSGSLSGDATARRYATASLTGVGYDTGYWEPGYADISYTILGLVRALVRRFADAALAGVGSLAATALRRAVPTIALSGVGSLVAKGVRQVTTGLSALIGSGALSAALRLKQLYLKTIALLRSVDTAAGLDESTTVVSFGVSQSVVVWRQTMPFTIKKGDTRPVLSAFLQESNGDPIDLTGATVRVIMLPAGGGAAKVNALATIIDAPNGEIEYQWFEGDTDTAGGFEVEFEVTFPGHVVGPETTISFQASDNSINDSANGLAGFSVGDTIDVSGSGSNDGKGKAASVAAGKIVVDDASQTLLDEIAGASVTLTHAGHRITVPNAAKGAEVTITDELGSAP